MIKNYTDAEILEAWSQSGPPIMGEPTMIARFRNFVAALPERPQAQEVPWAWVPSKKAMEAKTASVADPGLDPKGEAGKEKAPMELLPPVALIETAWVHGLGAAKYGRNNWRENKVKASTYVSAIMRHLAAWQRGEDIDPESGRSHLAHIAAGCNILMDAKHFGTLDDDRPKDTSKGHESEFEAFERGEGVEA